MEQKESDFVEYSSQNGEKQRKSELDENLSSLKVLDHVARIELDVKPNEPFIFSYHYAYKDYLEKNSMIDVIDSLLKFQPERALILEQKKKMKEKTIEAKSS